MAQLTLPLDELQGETPLEENGVPVTGPDNLAKQEIEEIAPDVEASTDEDYSISAMQSYLQTLPAYGDNITAKLGPEHKERMLLDCIICSTFNWLLSAATDKDPSFEPIIPDKEDKEYAISQKFYEFCVRAIAPIYEDLPDILRDMGMDALGFGNKAAERICSLQTSGPDTGKYYMRSIKPRGYDSYAYVTDPHMNVLGVAVRTVDGVDSEGRAKISAPSRPSKVNLSAVGGNYGVGLPAGWKLLPVDKFSILTMRKRNGDPRGNSCLNHIYNEWWLIQSIFPPFLKFLLKFASPSIVATAPDGPAKINIGGKQVSVTKSMLRDLKGFENSSVSVLPNGSTFQLAQSQGQGEAFLGALSMLEQRIQIGITNQVLASAEGKHMARAAAQTHQDSRNVVVRGIRRMLENMIRDIFKYLIKINFGEEFVKYAPSVNLGRVDPEDMSSIMSGIASLKTSGYFRDEQARGLDSMFGFPRREAPKFADPEPAANPAPGGSGNVSKDGKPKPAEDKKPKPEK